MFILNNNVKYFMECLTKEKVQDIIAILLVGIIMATMLIGIILTGIERNQYNDNCEIFTKNIDNVPYFDCILYLHEFPDMTGQEMVDYHEAATDRLLNDRVYEKEFIDYDGLRKPITYQYDDFRDECYAFINDVKDVFGLKTFNTRHCLKYLEKNHAMTGQEMLDQYWDEISEKAKMCLKNHALHVQEISDIYSDEISEKEKMFLETPVSMVENQSLTIRETLDQHWDEISEMEMFLAKPAYILP